ncbi:MAG: response regulator [bacterium]
MTESVDDFQQRLLATFVVEAQEHLQNISSGLLKLEKKPQAVKRKEILEAIFRAVHSLKGASRAVSRKEIESICQPLESILSGMKGGKIRPTKTDYDTLHRGLDAIGAALKTTEHVDIQGTIEMLEVLESGKAKTKKGAVPPPAGKANTKAPSKRVIRKVPGESEVEKKKVEDRRPVKKAEEPKMRKRKIVTKKAYKMPELKKKKSAPEKERIKAKKEDVTEAKVALNSAVQPLPDELTVPSEKYTVPDTARISMEKLDSILIQAEELITVKHKSQQRLSDLRESMDRFIIWNNRWGRVRNDVISARAYLGKSINEGKSRQYDSSFSKLLEFVDWNREFMMSLEKILQEFHKANSNDLQSYSRMIDNLLEGTKRVMMQPFSSFLSVIPRMVRDLSSEMKKEIELNIRGEDIEIDKRILEEMKDPIIHLVRNAVDHGIETPAKRKEKNKTPAGKLDIILSQPNSRNVQIVIADDGGGIDLEGVKNAAVKRGIMTSAKVKKLSEEGALSLVYQSELSTSKIITDLSGRGLGLSIVLEKVENLGGEVTLESNTERGTTFTIRLPVSIATFRGILVRSAGQVFVIPISNVLRVLSVDIDTIKTVENRETILMDNNPVSLVRLDYTLELSRDGSEELPSDHLPIVVISAAETRIAFVVDEVINEQEILTKGLGKHISRVRNVSGTTTLGTDQVVPILNPSDLIKSAIVVQDASVGIVDAMKKEETARRSVIVAEDSVTSRMLLRNILETAGYDVTTAVDGSEAFKMIKEGQFDIVVSDVDMPRMDGFELTEKLRNDEVLGEIPVVLVTSLEAREDKERGLEVGADAYIVKSSFDRTNLLDTMRRLL